MSDHRPTRGTLAGALTTAAMLGLLVFFRDDLEAAPLRTAAAWCTVCAVLSITIAAATAPRGIWSPSSVFLVTCAVFHCGLLAALVAGRDIREILPSAFETWLSRSTTRVAIWLIALGLASFAFGVCVARLRGPQPPGRVLRDRRMPDELAKIAAIMMGVALVLWFLLTVRAGGVSILVGRYDTFLQRTETSPLWLPYLTMGLAMVFTAALPWSRWHRYTYGLFVAWMLLAFPLGLRGEILFPGIAALAVSSARRVPLSPVRTAIFALAVLAAIAAVRQIRAIGVADVGTQDVSVSPVDGLVELGASLRPVSEVVFWRSRGEPSMDGATYWAPIDRALYWVVPGWTRKPVERDERLMSVVIFKRSGPIGFSMIAEAYVNFAGWGVFGVMALIGFILGRIDTWPNTPFRQAVGGVVLLAMLNHVRNSFVPIPWQLLAGLSVVGAMTLAARLRVELSASRR